MKAWFLTSNGEDSDPCREMEVEGFRKSSWRMKGGDFTGCDLTEGVNAPISSAGSCNSYRSVEDFLQGFLECELDGGIRILALPTKEILSPIGDKETVRNRLHAGINADRLEARDRRSSR